jgi:riboflavin synthase
MFTGIVEDVCKVVAVRRTAHAAAVPRTDAVRLEIDLGELLSGLNIGASLAVNGACLTLAERRGSLGAFDVVPETWRQTTLQSLQPGDSVNVERSLIAGSRIDGHFVQGHIDGVGKIERVQRDGGETRIWVSVADELLPYIVRKGSIAVDGTSLTIVDVDGNNFSVALIPTTLACTTLGRRRPGELVNVETDVLARLVISRLSALTGGTSAARDSSLTWQRLQESGFLP